MLQLSCSFDDFGDWATPRKPTAGHFYALTFPLPVATPCRVSIICFVPPCGDFGWVWEGSEASLREAIARVGVPIEVEGQRDGGRDGGDAVGQSVYIRDPDNNLLEFIRYA